jgi:GNAT superfamily N-acetyltransferase
MLPWPSLPRRELSERIVGATQTQVGGSGPVAVYPATAARWADLAALFATAADPTHCWCMYWRYSAREYHGMPGDARRRGLQARSASDQPPGLLAYLGGQAVGWCSLSPREEFGRLQRSPTLRPVDATAVWSIVCFFVHRRARRQGVATALLTAAVAFARERGAAALEGYPVARTDSRLAAAAAYPGTVALFERVGFREVARRSPARAIMRYELRPERRPAG